MKVKVIIPYYDTGTDTQFVKDAVINVEDKANSDFYHIWKGNTLCLIEKKCCEKIEKNK